MADAPADGRFHLLERRMRMPGITANPVPPASADEFLRAWKLGRDGCPADAVGETQIFLEFGCGRGPNGGRGMAAARFFREIGPIEMRAQRTRPAGHGRTKVPAAFEECQMLLVASDGGRG